MRFAGVILFVLLAGCTTQPIPEGTPADKWRLTGKLGIRSPAYNGSVVLDWQRQPGSFIINLSGALGISAARIEGNQESLALFLPGEPAVLLSAGQLQSYLGYDLPVDHLDFWVRGLPDPKKSFSKIPRGFTQSGWRVDYLKYELTVPRKIRLARDDTRLTLVIRKWDF